MTELWTVDRVVELERLALEGKSPETAAETLGLEVVQIVGKARRLGLTFAAVAAASVVKASPAVARAEIAKPMQAAAAVPIVPAISFGHPRDGWSDERIAALKALVEEGKTASEIARPLRVTRNAVIGKCGRLELRLKGGNLPTQPSVKTKPASAVAKADAKAAAAAAKAEECARIVAAREAEARELARAKERAEAGRFPNAKTLLQLRETCCRYPLWTGYPEAATSLYCGEHRAAPSRYCRYHALRCEAPREIGSAA